MLNIDVDDVKFVINYDFPNNTEDYVHRIGRTGRSTNKGTSCTFFTPANASKAGDLISVLQDANQYINPELHEYVRGSGRHRGGGGRQRGNMGGGGGRDRGGPRGGRMGGGSRFSDNKPPGRGDEGGYRNGGNDDRGQRNPRRDDFGSGRNDRDHRDGGSRSGGGYGGNSGSRSTNGMGANGYAAGSTASYGGDDRSYGGHYVSSSQPHAGPFGGAVTYGAASSVGGSRRSDVDRSRAPGAGGSIGLPATPALASAVAYGHPAIQPLAGPYGAAVAGYQYAAAPAGYPPRGVLPPMPTGGM
uniref:Helicase C-terminal domain-containing protein n=1 Tax=Anopheles atroparvus TaxID=41427 RepID=A0A182J290_ANOAO